MTRDSRAIADQLGLLLQRRVRRGLYDEIVDGVHPLVDAMSYPVLSGIARHGTVSAAALAADIGVDRSLASRRAAELVAGGLLEYRADRTDRRTRLLALTPAGERVVASLRARLDTAVDRRLRGWPAGDRRQFQVLLTRFVGTLDDDTEAAPRPGRQRPR